MGGNDGRSEARSTSARIAVVAATVGLVGWLAGPASGVVASEPEDLGTLGGTQSTAQAINGSGTITGGADLPDGSQR